MEKSLVRTRESDWFSSLQMLELDACSKCQECIGVCPTVTAGFPDGAMERISSWQNLHTSGFSLLKQIFSRKEPDLSFHLSHISKTLSRCTSCGMCSIVCESGINTTALWESMRGACRDLGYRDTTLEMKTESILQNKNPYHESHENRTSWIPTSTTITKNGEIGFFAGCTISYRNPELGKAALRILEGSGTLFYTLGPEEFCCGSFLFRTGTWKKYSDTILAMIQNIQEKGIYEILVPCAGCLKTITLDWPRIYGGDLPFRVTSFSSFIREKLREKKITFQSLDNTRIIYHDPCHGGRHLINHLGEDIVFEAHRDIISAIPGVTMVEFSQNRKLQSCCGAGGGLKTGEPALSGTIAGNKLKLAEQLDVDILVSTCPFCERNFSDAHSPGSYSFEIMDLIELVDHVMVTNRTVTRERFLKTRPC